MDDSIRSELPTYLDLFLPTLRAVDTLGGTAQAREVTSQVLADIGATDEQVAHTYDNRPKSVLIDRIDWARSYAGLSGTLDRPKRGLYVLSPLGRGILALPETEAQERVRELDREVRARRRQQQASTSVDEEQTPEADDTEEPQIEGDAS